MGVYGLSAFIFSLLFKKKIQSKISAKKMLISSELLKLFGLITLFSFNFTWIYCIAQILLGMSYSLGAGCDSNIIYEEFKEGASDFQAKSNSYMFNTLLISGLLGSWLFERNINYPITATAICTLIGIFSSAILIPDKKTNLSKISSIENEPIKLNLAEKKLILSYSFLRGIILSIFTGFLPYHFFVDLEIPTYYFILILTSYTLIGSISSKTLPRCKGNVLIFPTISLAIALTGYFYNNIYTIVISTILLGISSGAIRPVVANSLKKDGHVSHCLDLAEKLYSIINVLFIFTGGFIYIIGGFSAILVLAIIILITYVILMNILNFIEKRKNNENFIRL